MLGETRLWPLTYRDDHICGCGKPKTTCPFWSDVIDSLPDQLDADRAFRRILSRTVLAAPLVPKSLAKRLLPDAHDQITRFYAQIAAKSGATVAIDSSKNPGYGLLLDQVDGLEMTFVHIIRHPLGVVYSWKRQRNRSQDVLLYRQSKPLFVAAIEWTASNFLAEIMKRRVRGKVYTLNYEEIGTEKADTLINKIVETHDRQGARRINHTMAGNPGSAARQAEFLVDEEWQTGLNMAEKLLCGLVTYPLYFFYAGRR